MAYYEEIKKLEESISKNKAKLDALEVELEFCSGALGHIERMLVATCGCSMAACLLWILSLLNILQ